MILEVEGLNKSIGGKRIIKDISFQMEQGDCLAIIGPSGRGRPPCLDV